MGLWADSGTLSLLLYGGGGAALVLLVLFVACLVRLRLRRSQHRCTVRKVKGAAVPPEAGARPPASASRSRSESQVSLHRCETG